MFDTSDYAKLHGRDMNVDKIQPAPILAVTATTKLRHLPAWPWAKIRGLTVPRVAVSRGFRYFGPVFRSW